MFGHFEPDAELLCCFGGIWSGVALVDVGQFDCRVSYLLHLFSQRGDLLAVALVGGCDLERQQLFQRVHLDMNPSILCVAWPRRPVIGGAPDFGVDYRVLLLRQTAVDWPLRPAHSRMIDCASATKALAHPHLPPWAAVYQQTRR